MDTDGMKDGWGMDGEWMGVQVDVHDSCAACIYLLIPDHTNNLRLQGGTSNTTSDPAAPTVGSKLGDAWQSVKVIFVMDFAATVRHCRSCWNVYHIVV